MGLQFELINLDKKELISFAGIGVGTKLHELAGMTVAGNIVSWYLLRNAGDRISFVNDTENTQMLFGNTYSSADFSDFKDVTLRVVHELVKAEILQFVEVKRIDENEDVFDSIFSNIWDPAVKRNN